MHRRDLFRLGGAALLWTTLSPLAGCGRSSTGAGTEDHLFVSPDDLPRVRANAQTPSLRPIVEEWSAVSADNLRSAFDQAIASGNIIRDLRVAIGAMTRMAAAHLVDPTTEREAALNDAIGAMIDVPKWDYFYDGDDVIGIMRSSLANSRLLFTREVLAATGAPLAADRDAALLDAIAEKGCLTCYRTIYDMDHPEAAEGWRFAEGHESVYEIDMRRWPEILGANNLRAIPTMGLGLGALVLDGHDDRAGQWLDTAVASTQTFLGFFSPDGSYFEGLSYVDYALRTLLQFVDAHQRMHGTVDWGAAVNWTGVADFILTMQAGRADDGTPDIVNFSDARKSTYPCVPAWIAQQTGSGVAQYAAEEVSEPGYFLDLLWHDPEREATPPPDRLKNRRLDLDWIICRTGWDAGDAVLAFRSGGPANHEHADRNSFLFKIHGERLLTDHFGAAYDWREPGWLLRLTEAHNAVLIDGEGHQYHEGEEGTNESQAEARILQYEAASDRVWWSSDATQAYRLVHPNVVRVVRTVAFAKPDVIVLLDHVALRDAPARVDVRFFPDHRDGAADLQTEGTAFTIGRPGAVLHGAAFARTPVATATDRLDLPADLGAFPFVEVTSPEGTAHEVVTVLTARPADDAARPVLTAAPDADGWTFTADGVQGRIDTTGEHPVVRWG